MDAATGLFIFLYVWLKVITPNPSYGETKQMYLSLESLFQGLYSKHKGNTFGGFK